MLLLQIAYSEEDAAARIRLPLGNLIPQPAFTFSKSTGKNHTRREDGKSCSETHV